MHISQKMILDFCIAKYRNTKIREKDLLIPEVWEVLVYLSEVSYGVLA